MKENIKIRTKSEEPEIGLKVQEVENNISNQEFFVKNRIPGLCLDVQVEKPWGEACWNE